MGTQKLKKVPMGTHVATVQVGGCAHIMSANFENMRFFGPHSADEGPHFTKNWVPIMINLGPHGMWPQCNLKDWLKVG